jgi:hypothetical protein
MFLRILYFCYRTLSFFYLRKKTCFFRSVRTGQYSLYTFCTFQDMTLCSTRSPRDSSYKLFNRLSCEVWLFLSLSTLELHPYVYCIAAQHLSVFGIQKSSSTSASPPLYDLYHLMEGQRKLLSGGLLFKRLPSILSLRLFTASFNCLNFHTAGLDIV